MTNCIDAPNGCTVTATYRDLHAQCPFDDHADTYTVNIEWTTHEGKSIEYQSLTKLIQSYEGLEISHEKLVTELQQSIDYPVTITVTGKHYNLEVTVTTSQ